MVLPPHQGSHLHMEEPDHTIIKEYRGPFRPLQNKDEVPPVQKLTRLLVRIAMMQTYIHMIGDDTFDKAVLLTGPY